MSMTTTHVRFEKSYISWKSSTTKTTTQVELKKHSNLNSNAISTSWRTNFTEKYLGPINNFKTCNLQQLDSLHRQEHLEKTPRRDTQNKVIIKTAFFPHLFGHCHITAKCNEKLHKLKTCGPRQTGAHWRTAGRMRRHTTATNQNLVRIRETELPPAGQSSQSGRWPELAQTADSWRYFRVWRSPNTIFRPDSNRLTHLRPHFYSPRHHIMLSTNMDLSHKDSLHCGSKGIRF